LDPSVVLVASSTGQTVVEATIVSVVMRVVFSVAGQLVTVGGQAVIVAVRVVNTVEVVISGVWVSAGKVIVGSMEIGVVSAVDSEDAGAPGVETEDSMPLLEAGLTGPVIVVVKVIGPMVLLGESESMSDGDPDPSGLG
jgi:hypothetical protein